MEHLFVTEYIGDKDTDTERICGTCGRLKPVGEFYKDGRNSNGKIRYRRDCIECYKKTRITEAKLKEHNK